MVIMGIQELQKFIEENCKDACKPVDLIKQARGLALSQAGKRKGPNRLCLIVDGESCLDRLYGGFYSDWACGGQWNRMNQFLGTLIEACAAAHMELVVYFNGAFECSRLQEWHTQQQTVRKNASNVLKHITNKATPPPKVWWIPPVTLRSSLRMALRQWGVPVASSLEDHHQEVMAYCREHGFHGIVADESDYAIFDPPRYFSSQHLKLTYKGALETVEFVLDEVAKSLDLHPNRFAVLAALLGTHLLSEQDLEDFFFRICNVSEAHEIKKINSTDIIKAVVEFVRVQPSIDDLDAIGKVVFETETHKISKFKQTVKYYLNGTEEQFMKFRREVRAQARSNQFGARMNGSSGSAKRDKKAEEKVDWDGDKKKSHVVVPAVTTENGVSEDLPADNVYTQNDSGYALSEASNLKAPEIVVDPPSTGLVDGDADELAEAVEEIVLDKDTEAEIVLDKDPEAEIVLDKDPEAEIVLDKDAEAEIVLDKDPEAEIVLDKDPEAEIVLKKDAEAEKTTSTKSKEEKERKKAERKERERKMREQNKHMYKLSQDAVKICRERHSKGIMHPWVYQILMQQEIRIDATLEDENSRDLPAAVDLFRPIRQNVYAILFDYNKRILIHKNETKEAKEQTEPKEVPEKPTVCIKEWVVARTGASGPQADEVTAVELEWLVPGLHRLWLGQLIEDKNRRLRAFLSALNSDVPLMLNTSFVPQHLIVLCAVLRYIVKFRDQRVLRKHELDAFLCTAVSPLLRDVETMQEMKLPALTARGVQLGSLFMRGVEHAVFVNDACGAPVPWGMTCPWNFFDGKLFHFKLLKANNNPHLLDMCDGQMDQLMRVERMRQAVLQDVPLDLVFAKPPLPPQQGNFMPQGHNMRGPGPHPQGNGRGGRGGGARGRGIIAGHGHGQVDARGGQLQIAGVVISNWGPNMQSQQQKQRGGRGDAPPPQVTSVGPRRGGSRGVVSSAVARGRGMPGRPGGNMRGGAMSSRGQGPRGYPGGGNMYNNNMRGGSAGPGGPGYQHQGGYYSPMRGRGGMPGMNGRGGAPRGGGRVGNGGPGMGPKPGNHLKAVSLEQRTKSPSGRGRGCTVETQQDNVVTVSQLIKEQNLQHYNATAAASHLQQQQQAQSNAAAIAVAASQAQQLAASQGQQMSHMMSHSHGMTPTQVSMSQAQHMPSVSLNHSQIPPHMNLTQSQMAHGQLQGQMGTHVQGLLSAAQMASMAISQDVNLGPTAQMPQLALNGQADFAHYAANMQADLSALGPNDLSMINQEFNMAHMGAGHDRIGMFDMGTEQM